MRSVTILKSLCLGVCLYAMPSQAADPSPDLLTAWQTEAQSLHDRLASLQGHRIPDIMRAEISRFGRIAGRLAEDADASDVSDDLGCIFRGMSEESRVQLEAIANAVSESDFTTARKRLLSMLEDAVLVSEAAEGELTGLQALQSTDSKATSCKPGQLSKSDYEAYFTEQP